MIEESGSGSIPLTREPDPDPGGPKHMDPMDPVSDPDPQHWLAGLPIQKRDLSLIQCGTRFFLSRFGPTDTYLST
jgi:hypothetical protein